MVQDAFLEVVIIQCPKCKNFIAEPSWFVDLEQEIQCSNCKTYFQSSENEKDRVMLKFLIKNNKINEIEVMTYKRKNIEND